MNPKIDLTGKTPIEVLELLGNFQRALDNEKKFHDTLDNLLEGFQIIGFDWRYLYVNNAVVTQSKISREELLGRTMMEKYPGIEHTEMFKVLSVCMDTRVAKQFENEFTYPDGSTGCFELSMQPCEEGVIILSNDISERKKREQEKKEYTQELEELIFMNSHNLRQPVTHILGIIHFLNNCSKSAEDMTKIASYLKESIEALDGHTRELTARMHAMNLKTKK